MHVFRMLVLICACVSSGCSDPDPLASTIDGLDDSTAAESEVRVSSDQGNKTSSRSSSSITAGTDFDERYLTIGDLAPPISVSSWPKGTGTAAFLPGQIYVVEFWATWCAPCLDGMTHLSELQKRFGDDVLILGITSEDEKTVESFFASSSGGVKTWREIVTYAIGLDDAQSTFRNYMEKSGDVGIPKAFIVGPEGHIEWIGQPMRLDEPLAQVVDGTWDRNAARELYTQLARAVILRREGRAAELASLQSKIVKEQWNNANVLMDLAAAIANSPQPRNLKLALRAARRANLLTNSRDVIALRTLAWVHYERNELDSAITWQRRAVQASPGDVNLQAALEMYDAEYRVLGRE